MSETKISRYDREMISNWCRSLEEYAEEIIDYKGGIHLDGESSLFGPASQMLGAAGILRRWLKDYEEEDEAN